VTTHNVDVTPMAATDVNVAWWVVAAAFGVLAVGLFVYFWGARKRAAGHARSISLIAWFLVAMWPTLLLFSLFPDSSAEGDFAGITLGGAFAGFAALWYFGTRQGNAAIDRDQAVEDLKSRVGDLQARVATGADPTADPPLRERRELHYRVDGRKDKELVVRTGDLLDVHDAHVWVSSENTHMQMARYYERSISALVRYYGSVRDADGDVLEDTIADDLSACMRGRGKLVVPPAAVIATTSGKLAETHGVKRILHVAAVQGEPGAGYRPIAEIGRCATHILERVDADDALGDGVSIVFPLLGTGVGLGQANEIAAKIVAATAEYLHQYDASRVTRVYLLAYRQSDLHYWVHAADACSLLERVGGTADQLLGAVA
jgi:O-acetyl-ADP-ribose deacetylase (regulator of RNase III)